MGGGGKAMKAGAIAQDGRGRFMSSGGLTDKQSAFVTAYLANGGKQTDAARKAAYSDPTADGWKLLRNPAVLTEIHNATTRLVATGGSIGVSVLINVATDTAAPAAARVSAAKWLAEAAGHGLAATKAGQGGGLDDKPLEEMTIAELESFIGGGRLALEQSRARHAGTISVEVEDVTRNDTRNDSDSVAQS